MTSAYRIDVHAHFPVDLRRPPDDQGMPWSSWNTEDAIRRLDRLQIRRQYLSLPALPSTEAGDWTRGSGMAGAVNDRFASIIAQAPERFGAFATVPGDDLDAALVEAHHALDVLGLHGIALTSNSNGRYLGDPWYEPLFALAQSRGVPVFVHPALDPRAASLTLGRPAFLVEFPVDTFRSITDAIYAGVFQRHRDLKVIAAHCGGALPALAWRISSLAHLIAPNETGDAPRQRPADIRRDLQRLYLDTALSGSAEVLHSAIALVGHARLLYGTDCGAATDDVIAANTEGLAQAGLSRAELADIEYENAAALFAHQPERDRARHGPGTLGAPR
jgi:predicted TIM-barrel fold metal-dependent hydrolase